MKKLIFSICAVVFVALTAININIAVKGEKVAELNLASPISLAQGEDETPCVLWTRSDGDCEYSFTGKAGATITILGGVTITIGADGSASYTYGGGKTECTAGGDQQCEARYCPSL